MENKKCASLRGRIFFGNTVGLFYNALNRCFGSADDIHACGQLYIGTGCAAVHQFTVYAVYCDSASVGILDCDAAGNGANFDIAVRADFADAGGFGSHGNAVQQHCGVVAGAVVMESQVVCAACFNGEGFGA